MLEHGTALSTYDSAIHEINTYEKEVQMVIVGKIEKNYSEKDSYFEGFIRKDWLYVQILFWNAIVHRQCKNGI